MTKKSTIKKDNIKKIKYSNKRYLINKTFEYNKDKGPFELVKDSNNLIKKSLGRYGIESDFFGYKTKLPIGVAAGPLYNKRYMTAAMNDGFTVITWKTFRSVDRLAHRNNGKFTGHNIIFLDNDKMLDDNNIAEPLRGKTTFNGDAADVTISNSFGMPSSSPLQWMPDITEIEKIAKKKNKLIISSVVGTPVADGDIYDLANDYTFTARCAELAGANIIELNLSCPNVCGKEGQIYKSAQDAMIVAKSVRRGLNPKTKLLLKIGYSDIKSYKEFITKTGQYIDGIVAINTIAMKIVDDKGNQALPGGLNSGVCGKIIIDKSVEAVKNLSSAKKALGDKYKHIKIIGCGGVTTPEAFIRHIDAGAEYVMCATSALFNPTLPLQIANYIKENKINIKIK